MQAHYYTGRVRKDGWTKRKRLDSSTAPTMTHQYGKPVCDACYICMQRLLEGRRQFFVCSVSFDPDADLDVYLVAVAFAGQLWSAAVSEPDVTGVEGSGK